jgi:hypothetical protein
MPARPHAIRPYVSGRDWQPLFFPVISTLDSRELRNKGGECGCTHLNNPPQGLRSAPRIALRGTS